MSYSSFTSNVRNIEDPIDQQRKLYQKRYGDRYYKKEIYFEQFLHLKQGDLTVNDYMRQYQNLEFDCNLKGIDKDDKKRYMSGLRLEIQDKMRFCMTIQEAYLEAFPAKNEIFPSQEENFQQRSRAHIVERLSQEKIIPHLSFVGSLYKREGSRRMETS